MFIWYGAGAVAAIAIAWLAALLHASGHAPVGLISLATGITLGWTVAKIAATLRIADKRRHLVIASILFAIVVVLAEHSWLYLDFRRQWHASREQSPQVAIFRPDSPWSPRQFFENGASPLQVTVWCVDAALIVISTASTVLILTNRSASCLKTTATP